MPFLSTTGATTDVPARIIKLTISKKEETTTFKSKDTKKCNQVMVTTGPERNAMTPDKKHSAGENFSTKFSRCVSYPVLRPKPSIHSMCARNHVHSHTVHKKDTK
jgi:hypothetical protein